MKIYRLESLGMGRNDLGTPMVKRALAKNDLFGL